MDADRDDAVVSVATRDRRPDIRRSGSGIWDAWRGHRGPGHRSDVTTHRQACLLSGPVVDLYLLYLVREHRALGARSSPRLGPGSDDAGVHQRLDGNVDRRAATSHAE